MKNKTDTQTKGEVMVWVGFLMILFNALSYLLNWSTTSAAVGIVGLVFVAVGLRMTKGRSRF